MVEAPDGLAGRARAAPAAGGRDHARPGPDTLVVLRRFRDPDGPARLVAAYLLGRRRVGG